MNNRKQIFFTSDWHIGHENVLKFDNRPFLSLEEMHRTLIHNFNKQVPINGLTYFLGDMALSGTEVTRSVISKLNGTKVLILGNHDKNSQSCYNVGFDVVVNNVTIYIQNKKVTLSHCPLKGLYREDTSDFKNPSENWHGESKNDRFSINDENQFHLHGHIHSPNGGKSVKILNKQFDVGVVANKYRPVHISEIESWIMKYE